MNKLIMDQREPAKTILGGGKVNAARIVERLLLDNPGTGIIYLSHPNIL